MNIRNILILTDLSETATDLLRYGWQLAQALSAKVWVQHVYYFPPDLAGDVLVPVDAMERYEQQAYVKLEKLTESIASAPESPVQCFVVRGDLVVQANRAIDQHRIDLLLVGNRGGGLSSNILGSRTLKLIYHANCPVLSVPQQATFQPFHRIAFATDWHRTSEKNISQLRNLVKQFNAHLDVIHVSTSEKAAESDEATSQVNQVPGTLHYLWSEHIEEGLQEHIEQHQNDLLVLIPHQHSFFDRLFQKSITRQMVYHSQIPLLTLRE